MSPSATTTETEPRAFRRFADGRPVGDVIPVFHDGEYHLFILTPPEGTLYFPERLLTTWRHIKSQDLVHWSEVGDAIEPGTPDSFDGGGIWTGSAISAEGRMHIFYTGFATTEYQTIGHAVSDDGIVWAKSDVNPISSPIAGEFEPKDWRDPYVFWNDDEQRYWMLITARSATAPAPSKGVVALSKSTDLVTWSEAEVFYSTFMTHSPECSEIFHLDGRWVLGYSRFSDRKGTVYRVSDQLTGPWRAIGTEGPDAAHWYAAKGLTAEDGRRIAFGWVPDHDPAPSDRGKQWLWGGDLSLARELNVTPGGAVTMTLPDEVSANFGDSLPYAESPVPSSGGQSPLSAVGAIATRTFELSAPEESSVLTARFSSVNDTHLIGVIVHTTPGLDRGVGVFYYPQTRVIRAMDMRTRDSKIAGENEDFLGHYETVAEHDLAEALPGDPTFVIVTRGDIVEAFVGGVACLTYRVRAAGPHQYASLVAVDSTCEGTLESWQRLGR